MEQMTSARQGTEKRSVRSQTQRGPTRTMLKLTQAKEVPSKSILLSFKSTLPDLGISCHTFSYVLNDAHILQLYGDSLRMDGSKVRH
jgi:hypothetical protein